MSIDSGVSACLRTGARLATSVAIAAFIAGGLSTIAAPAASADESSTVEAQTPSTPVAHLASQRDASFDPGSLLTSDCSTRAQGTRGIFASAVPTSSEAGILEVAVPECSPTPALADATRVVGRTQSANPGAAGQCTWGAAQKWFEASGSYPALVGDAMSWSEAATAAGWTVTDDARDRSIVVFKPGVAGAGSIGHVAWVDSVSQTADGPWIHVTEMNNSYYGGLGIFNDRDIKDIPGMSYILLP